MNNTKKTTGKVSGIIANLVIVQVEGPVAQNEICYISHDGTDLMAEVIKIIGNKAYTQVFESTRGLKIGSPAIFEGHMLEATLGPGILSSVYDGLMHDLHEMTGIFLKPGEYTRALDPEKIWDFKPLAKGGDQVIAADWLGEVIENSIPHRIMVPFVFEGRYTAEDFGQLQWRL